MPAVAAAPKPGTKRPRGASNGDALASAAVTCHVSGTARAPAAASPAAHDSDDELFAGAQRRRTSHAGDAAKHPSSTQGGGVLESDEGASDEFFAVEGDDQRGDDQRGGGAAGRSCARTDWDMTTQLRSDGGNRAAGSNHFVDDGVASGWSRRAADRCTCAARRCAQAAWR